VRARAAKKDKNNKKASGEVAKENVDQSGKFSNTAKHTLSVLLQNLLFSFDTFRRQTGLNNAN
jgi:hypothetical protein